MEIIKESDNMNKIKEKEKKIYNSYKPTPGAAPIHTCKKNVVYISNNITVKHELAKCIGAIMIKRFGDVKFSGKLIRLINEINDEISDSNMVFNSTNFITEAVPNLNIHRRIDLVNLGTGDEFEFETDHSVSKDGAITIYI